MATTVEHTIGTGGDYATLELWLAATADPVGDDAVYVGKLKSQTHTLTSGDKNFSTLVDATRYQVLTYETEPFDIRTGDGPKLTMTWTSNFQRVTPGNYAQLIGIGYEISCGGFGSIGIRVSSVTGVVLDGCTIILTGTTEGTPSTSRNCGVYFSGSNLMSNCMVVDRTTSGSAKGVTVRSGSTVANCSVYGSNDVGVYQPSVESCVVRNVVAIDCATCFTTADTPSYLVSSDATASGTGSITDTTAAACFEDSASDDFRPKDGGPLDDAGTDLSGTFTTDITGATRSLWSIGAYDAPPTPAGTPPDDPTGAAADDSIAEQITVTWTDNATDEDNYVVERSADGSTGWSVLTSSLPAGTETYTDSSLTPTDTWYYRVKATNAYGDSAYTSVVSGTVIASAATAVITKNFSTTEYIPAHFSFSAWDSVVATGSIHEYGFKWTVSGGSEHDGVFNGPNLGLVWETAGTFTVRLDILDADGVSLSNASTTVTVATPTYDTTLYVSAAGSDANDGLSSGAPKLTLSAAWTALKAAHTSGDHSRIVLNRGDTFSLASPLPQFTSTEGFVYVDSYGSGDKPVVQCTTNFLTHYNSDTVKVGHRFMNLRMTRPIASGFMFTMGVRDDQTVPRGTDVVWIDCEFAATNPSAGGGNFIYPLEAWSGSNTYTPSEDADGIYSHSYQGNYALQRVVMVGYDQYCIYGFFGNWASFYECEFLLPENVTGVGHAVRIPHVKNFSARSCTFGTEVDEMTCLRIQSAASERGSYALGTSPRSSRVTVEGCTFLCGGYNAITADYANDLTDTNLYKTPAKIAILNNKFVPHPNGLSTNGLRWVEGYCDKLVLAGNTFYSPGVGQIFSRREGSDMVADGDYEVLIANNSVVSASTARLVQLPTDDFPFKLTFKNNSIDAPSAVLFQGNGTNGSVGLTTDRNVADVLRWAEDVDAGTSESLTFAQFQSTYIQDANSTAADPLFTDPANDDWSIGVDSPCYDAGQNIGASWLTREGTERSGTWDIGAFEIPAASPTSENMSGYLNLANIRVRAGQTLAMAFTGTGNAKGRYILTVELE